MSKNTKKENELVQLLIGLAMLCVGGYAFANNISVHTGFYWFRIGGYQMQTGFVVVPFIIGIIMLFAAPDKLVSKLVTFVGLLIIVASIIMGTTFTFHNTSLYVYLLMIIGMFGGLTLVLKALLRKPKPREDSSSNGYGMSFSDGKRKSKRKK